VAAVDLEQRVRDLCLSLPEATERLSHGAPAFFAGKQFLQLWPHGHHDQPLPHLWCAASPGAQQRILAEDPRRYFRPPYVGSRGWVGVLLDRTIDWDEVADLCEDAYRSVASRRLVALLEKDSGERDRAH
jgi:predicted DNA-binding protein (MmcQ/YjbR family)